MDLAHLRHPELFSNLNDTELAVLAALGEEVRLDAGAVLFDEDTVGDDLWLVGSGMVKIEIMLPGSGDAVGIAQVKTNEIVGELALIDGHRRSATARASIDATLYRFRRATLMKALAEHEHVGFVIMQNLARIVARRLRDTNLALRATLAQQRQLLGALF